MSACVVSGFVEFLDYRHTLCLAVAAHLYGVAGKLRALSQAIPPI